MVLATNPTRSPVPAVMEEVNSTPAAPSTLKLRGFYNSCSDPQLLPLEEGQDHFFYYSQVYILKTFSINQKHYYRSVPKLKSKRS